MRRLSTGAKMVVSSMAILVLQLFSRRGSAADERYMATTMPVATWMPFTTRSLVSSILLCGLLHASASGCCIDATQDAAANTVGSAEPPAKPLAKPLGTGTTPDENTALDGFLAARAWLDADALPAAGTELTTRGNRGPAPRTECRRGHGHSHFTPNASRSARRLFVAIVSHVGPRCALAYRDNGDTRSLRPATTPPDYHALRS